MLEPLTNVERKVYHYLIDFLSENTYQPSVRDIGAKFRIKSTKTVSELLQSIADKGYIERNPSRSRGVHLRGYAGARKTQPVPFYGKIAAGEPALLEENLESFITMDRRFLPSERVFFLEACGDSMRGRGIFDGDYILVDPDGTPRDGDVVAARLGEDGTVKTLTHQGGRVVLESANAADRDITVSPDQSFTVLGVVAGVFRPFQEMEHTPENGNAAEE
ncbi:MAG TPA: transcriptional repressor LexA [Gemmatimonadaceae bacterium]|jgi:SOS regulatory protein LexA